jgi:hypothetical protein
MNYIESVNEVVDEFTKNPECVQIRTKNIKKLAIDIQQDIKANQLPKWVAPAYITNEDGSISFLMLYELIANSINYCYWYGNNVFRPRGASSVKMYSLLTDSFEEMDKLEKTGTYSEKLKLEIIIEKLIKKLSRERFPLLEQRIKHLNELLKKPIAAYDGTSKIEEMLDYIITSFPGYAQDLFLKRALLYIIQLNRLCGVFEDEMNTVPVPADYQVPKMLNHFGCIVYSLDLSERIRQGILIPEGSLEECEIRASTIKVCGMLAIEANCKPSDVDTYLWTKRKQCNKPFHLTITTNY